MMCGPPVRVYHPLYPIDGQTWDNAIKQGNDIYSTRIVFLTLLLKCYSIICCWIIVITMYVAVLIGHCHRQI